MVLEVGTLIEVVINLCLDRLVQLFLHLVHINLRVSDLDSLSNRIQPKYQQPLPAKHILFGASLKHNIVKLILDSEHILLLIDNLHKRILQRHERHLLLYISPNLQLYLNL